MRRKVRSGLSFFLALILSGCAVASRHPVPKEAVGAAQIPGLGHVRLVVEPGSTNLLKDVTGFLAGFGDAGGTDHQLRILALSGGGENGAYGAGLLCGWTEAGTRPEFDLITGVGTGSLIAPLAFMGTNFDSQLRHKFTEIKPDQIFQKRGFWGILKHRDAAADSKPLQKLIAETIGEPELAAIAREHRKGRRLLIMTSNLDAQKPVIWDIGAIAASGELDALNLIRKVLLASSAIPAAFPPVLFDVEAGGLHYDELHVDGGVMAQVFGGALLLPYAADHKASAPIDFYLVLNGRLRTEYKATQREISSIAARSIGSLMKVQSENDILRAWMFTKASGGNFHYVSIPDDFQTELKDPFDTAYRKALFEVGRQQGQSGIPWLQTPRGLQDVDWSRTTASH